VDSDAPAPGPEADAPDAPADPPPDAEPAADGRRRRRVLVSLLLAAAVVVGFVAMFSVWANRQALNTDNWTDTSSRLLADPKIQAAVGAYMVDELFSNVDVAAQLRQVLPPQAQALAGPGAAGLQQLAGQAAPELLARPRVQQAWRQANRAAHRQLLQVLNGGGPAVSTSNGQVVLNLHTLVNELAARLGVSQQAAAARAKLQGGTGAKVRGAAQQKLGVTLPPSSGQLVILRSDQLSTAQDVASAVRHLAVWLTILALALFALAVALAVGWRRIALRSVGWCFFGLGLFVLLLRRVVGNRIVDGLVTSDTVRPAAHSAWSIASTLLYDIAIAMVAYGLLIVIAAWLAGPTRSAVAVRRALAPELRHRLVAVYGAVAIIYLLVLAWGPTQATRTPIGIIGIAILLVLGVELLRRQTAREFPDARREDTGERIRAGFGAVRGGFSRRESGSPEPTDGSTRVVELERLAALHDRGALTDAEYDAQKGVILSGS
jgi:hypothetical protein